jgi:hypothetical protein
MNIKMEQKIKLELTVHHLNVVISGLMKLPMETAMTTFAEVQKQADTQLNINREAFGGSLSDKVLN